MELEGDLRSLRQEGLHRVQSVCVAQAGQKLLVVDGSSCMPSGVRVDGSLKAWPRRWSCGSEGCHRVLGRCGVEDGVADAQPTLLYGDQGLQPCVVVDCVGLRLLHDIKF